MSLPRLDFTPSCPSLPPAAATQSSQRTISSGLSSIPSKLENSPKESAHGFSTNDCMDAFVFGFLDRYSIRDCLYYCLQEGMTFLKRLFPCFFSSEEALVQGPLSPALLEERVALAKQHVQDQLQIRNSDQTIARGLYPKTIINGGKVAVLLQYNNTMDFCARHVQDGRMLRELTSLTAATIEAIVRDRVNREAQTADLSITTVALNTFTAHNGTQFVPMAAQHSQGCKVTCKSNRSNPSSCFDENSDQPRTKDEVMNDIKRYTTSPQISPEVSAHFQAALERFFYSNNT